MKEIRAFEYRDMEVDYSEEHVITMENKNELIDGEIKIPIEDVIRVRWNKQLGLFGIDGQSNVFITEDDAVDIIANYKQRWVDIDTIYDEIGEILAGVANHVYDNIKYMVNSTSYDHTNIERHKECILELIRECEDKVRKSVIIEEE